jgi:carboxymethylenebutenolidase
MHFPSLLFLSWFVLLSWFGWQPAAPGTTAHPSELLLEKPAPMCHEGLDPMAVFASDPGFIALHEAPLPIHYTGAGNMVEFSTADGKKAQGYQLKAKKKSDQWLFVYQEWWGLNDYIKKESDRLYQELEGKVNVLAVDLYDGQVTADPKEASKLIQGVQEERLVNIVKGAVAHAGASARIASIGWCFGGGWSLRSALLSGPQAIGSVIYYGMPIRDAAQLKTLNCDVLGLFATEERISRQVIEEFAAAMKLADKSLDYTIYNAAHAFANPSNPKYNQEIAQEANAKALQYLKAKFSK